MHGKVFKNAISVLQDYRYQGILDRTIILGPVQVGCYLDYIKEVGPEATIFNKTRISCLPQRVIKLRGGSRAFMFSGMFYTLLYFSGWLGI